MKAFSKKKEKTYFVDEDGNVHVSTPTGRFKPYRLRSSVGKLLLKRLVSNMDRNTSKYKQTIAELEETLEKVNKKLYNRNAEFRKLKNTNCAKCVKKRGRLK